MDVGDLCPAGSFTYVYCEGMFTVEQKCSRHGQTTFAFYVWPIGHKILQCAAILILHFMYAILCVYSVDNL